jgi:RNA exonuclease 4
MRVKQLHRLHRLLAQELKNLTHFLRLLLLLLSYHLFPSKALPKRKLLSAHLNDKNARKGTGKSSSSSTVFGGENNICYVDASFTTSSESGSARVGVSCYYSPGHCLNFAAAASRSSCKDSNSAEVLALLVCVLRHDFRERLTIYTDSRYALKCAESFRSRDDDAFENARDGKTRWYLKCLRWALLSREGRTVVHKVKAHAEGKGGSAGGGGGGKKNGGGSSSYAARMNNARADALANYGAKSNVDVFQNLGSFWGMVVAMYRFASARGRRGEGEEAPANSSSADDDEDEDEEEKEEREYYERMAKMRPFGLGALRVVRNGRIINLFDEEEKEDDKEERKRREVRSGPPKPLNDDFSITDCLALDCEMVGVGLGGVKSVLGQVSVINEHLNVVYTSYCRPTETVTDYRTQWSGLTEVHLRDAPSFEEVQKKVMELFGTNSGGEDDKDDNNDDENNAPRRRIMTGHGLENDLEVLRMTHPKELLRDTATWKPILRPPHFKKPQKLRKLVKIHCNFSIQQTTTSGTKLGHDPSEDARGSMVLYLKFRSRWEHDIATRGAARANIASSRYR